jgi:hypothetical protein
VSEAVRDDLYVAGGTVTVRGPVDGDVAAVGGRSCWRAPLLAECWLRAGRSGSEGRSAVACGRPVEQLGWKRRWGRTRSWRVGS